MSLSRQVFLGVLLGLGWPALDGLGQTNVSIPSQPITRVGRVVLSEQQAVDIGLPLAPEDRQGLPLEIRERIRRFEAIREAYLTEQELLRKRLTGAATEEERDRIRALIKQSRDAWLARARTLREEARERLRELQTLLPSRSEILDAARERVRETHKRRGITDP